MVRFRVIARLDIKGPNVIKGIQMEGLRVIGNPADLARRYAEQGACELLYLDTVASLYGRNQLGDLLEETTRDVFVPVTVGGGISSQEEANRLLRNGADAVALNTAAHRDYAMVGKLASSFGSQAVTVSIEAKRVNSHWEAYTDCGRNRTGKDAVQWATEAVDRGAGQILVTSIDRDGTRTGFDLDLINEISSRVDVPVIASGGCRNKEDVEEARKAGANGVAIGAALHYGGTVEQFR
jgi:cyclase